MLLEAPLQNVMSGGGESVVNQSPPWRGGGNSNIWVMLRLLSEKDQGEPGSNFPLTLKADCEEIREVLLQLGA